MNRDLVPVRFVGVGAAVPETVLSNTDLSRIVDTSDEWIYTRTGIRERRVLLPQESVVDLATAAAQGALTMAGLAPEQVDLIILCTSTGIDRFSTAPYVQAKLGSPWAVAFDLGAACSGLVYGLVVGSQMIQTGLYQRVVVVAADALSRVVDWQDRTTCVLFGDGAGAIVLEAGEGDPGLLATELRTDGQGGHHLTLAVHTQAQILATGIPVGRYQPQPLFMNGREVYKFAVKAVPEVIEKVLFRSGLTAQGIQGYFIHQANQRILDAVSERLGIPKTQVASVLEHYGNTSGGSVAIALQEWIRQGRFQTGDVGVLAGFGAGLTWGALALRWGRF